MTRLPWKVLLAASLAIVAITCGAVEPAAVRSEQALACKGCQTPLASRELLSHLQAMAPAFGVDPRLLAYRRGDFERRWSTLRRTAQDSIDAEFRSEIAEAARAGPADYEELAGRFRLYAGRLRLASDLSRRVAASGYAGGVPGPACRSEAGDPLAVRACAFGLALHLRGVAAQVAYLDTIRVSRQRTELRIDYGIYLHRDHQLDAAAQALNQGVKDETPTAKAQALHHLANVLADANRLTKSAVAYEESLQLQRNIADHSTDGYWINLATTLNNYQTVLTDQGRHDDAERMLQEALALRLGLAMASPDDYLANVAVSLSNFRQLHDKRQRPDDAARAAELAVAIDRYLLPSRPALYRPELAGHLAELAGHYRELGQATQAEAAARLAASEALQLIRDDAPFHDERAQMLMLYGELRLEAGDRVVGNQALEEGVATYRFLNAKRPGEFGSALADALVLLAQLWEQQGRLAESMAAMRESQQLMVSKSAR